ncbi:MAG: apolipoprotein N-acyltransferase [Desulfomonile tiedjei]|uniref:Apolipoprotein N-acyltransferase n=1 Tax=Desulfomonile tiedjei TaxID=2358 RepID=A0A9D6Z219_9BACT|nr:apolipoprotein N-acyltransferase [Desulfomonile tiedjei]
MILTMAASAGGGLLLSLAFPHQGLDLLAWIAFVPLFWSIYKDPRPAAAALCGASFGVAFFLVDVAWIYRTLVMHGHFGVVQAFFTFLGLVLFLSMFSAIFGFILGVLSGRGYRYTVFASFFWAGLEYLRATAFTGFPWDLVGYSQANRLVVVQMVDITGIYGVSFLIVLVNATLWETTKSLMHRQAMPLGMIAATVAAVIFNVSYGSYRLSEFPPSHGKPGGFGIGILQGNIAQEIKWDQRAREYTFESYERLGREAVNKGARLLVWPETSVPVVFGEPDADWQRPGEISRNLGVPMLVGAPAAEVVDKAVHYYNSAFLVENGVLRERYDKIHLVPFGEYMPLSWLLPLGPGIAAREADYSPGTEMKVMQVDNGPRFSVLICYEAIFPELSRSAIKNGADMLINITNDGWFGATAAPYQHLAMARVRSVENRVWLLRCANTGISAAFDPAGRIVSEIPIEKQGEVTVFMPETFRTGSLYANLGDVFALSCVGIGCFLGVTGMDLGKIAASLMR